MTDVLPRLLRETECRCRHAGLTRVFVLLLLLLWVRSLAGAGLR